MLWNCLVILRIMQGRLKVHYCKMKIVLQNFHTLCWIVACLVVRLQQVDIFKAFPQRWCCRSWTWWDMSHHRGTRSTFILEDFMVPTIYSLSLFYSFWTNLFQGQHFQDIPVAAVVRIQYTNRRFVMTNSYEACDLSFWELAHRMYNYLVNFGCFFKRSCHNCETCHGCIS